MQKKCTYKVVQGELFFYDEKEKRNIFCTFKKDAEAADTEEGTPLRRIACKGWQFDFVLQPEFNPKANAVK